MSERASEHLMRHYAGFIPCGGLREVTPSPAASSPAGDTRPAIRTEYAGRTSFVDISAHLHDSLRLLAASPYRRRMVDRHWKARGAPIVETGDVNQLALRELVKVQTYYGVDQVHLTDLGREVAVMARETEGCELAQAPASTSFIAAGRSYRDHSGDIWTDPSCDDVGSWYLTSQRYGTRERFFADGRHWAAPGSSQDLVAVVGAPPRSRFRPVVVDEKDFISIGDFIAKLKAEPPLPVRRLRNEFADASGEPRAESDEDRPGDLFRKYEGYCEKERLTCFPRDASSSYTETQAEADVETALRATPDFALGFHPDDERTLTPREQREQVREEILILGVIGFISSLVLAASALGLMVIFGWGF